MGVMKMSIYANKNDRNDEITLKHNKKKFHVYIYFNTKILFHYILKTKVLMHFNIFFNIMVELKYFHHFVL